ncbi:hypothetical protein [Mesorhizobium mediterraneum]|uniref:hypothetical protein n=1 Tax=Mesorhizobium mediterraneum TaxID=43617 RepID=UPI00177D228E|nr:hypothetical protein [Mesorhizobium mediterraneum]
MSVIFTNDGFPSRADHLRALWTPVLFSPRLSSPENLVIGVASATETDFYLAEANAWRRLHCLFGDGAETALLAARVALDVLKSDLSERGQTALHEPRQTFSGITMGELREGEGSSLKQIATTWLASLSSLYDAGLAERIERSEDVLPASAEAKAKADRLPVLVLEYVEQHRPRLSSFFHAEIREKRERKRKPRAQDIYIGFAGSSLVANFATLPAKRSNTIIDHIKRLMWDLEQDRDAAGALDRQRKYEMIVKHQDKYDPHITEKQFGDVLEVVDELGEQGRKRDIAVVPRVTVPEIGNHMLELEQAA